ncbi:4Fe-4S dicluster domain-containing protein [Paradesulfitobacterium aromaticivorans]
MRQVGFLVDVSRCLGCRACEVACKNYFGLGETQRFRRVAEVEWQTENGIGLFYLSLACNHCESPECFRVCPNRTYRKRRDGIVVHDAGLCDGCCSCVKACPYGAPQYDADTGKVDKCDLCVSRLDAGLRPVCEEACTNGALKAIFLDRIDETGLLKSVPTLPDIKITRPSVRFNPPVVRKQWLNQKEL